MLDSNPGFNKDAIIILPPGDATGMRTLTAELRRLPSIADLTLQGHAPIGAAIIDMPVQYEGRKDRELRVSILAADDHFLVLSHIPDIEGGMGIRLVATGDRISGLTTTLAQIGARRSLSVKSWAPTWSIL